MGGDETFVHPSAVVHAKAQLDKGVVIGPFSIIGEGVVIHENTRIESNVTITGRTEIGQECLFSPFSSIGAEPQDLTYKAEETAVRIGDRNVFREFITIHRGTIKGGGETAIGSDNYFMAYSHVAHDCRVGCGTVFINGATLGGHVVVDDHATISAFTGVHQFCRIGKHAYLGGYTVITQDVLPFSRVAGSRPTLFYGLNAIGLRRKGYSRERIQALKQMFKIFFYSDLNSTQALEEIKNTFPPGEDRDEIIRFAESSTRGIVKKAAEKWENGSV